jgi:hypothetical protein
MMLVSTRPINEMMHDRSLRVPQVRVRPVRLTEVIGLFPKGTPGPRWVKGQMDAVYAVIAGKN